MTDDETRRTATPYGLYRWAQRTALETATESLRTASLLDERLADAADVEVGETPHEVVYSENKLELLRYESLTDDQHEVPLLVVYALINRPYILDLQPDRSIVRRMLEAGHDVYLVDWNEPSRLDSHLSLYDYVDRYIDNCVDVVRERSGHGAVNLLGYCMGGTMAAIYAARHPEKVNALALMAAGLYFDDTGGVLERWGDEAHYDPRAVTDALGNVPGEFLDVGFAAMDPVTNYATKYVQLLDRLENEDFVRNFARMETWLSESVDVAGEVYAEFLEEIYQDNSLYENELVIDGEHVDVTAIDMPMLQIVGEYDHLVPPAASTPFNDVVGSEEVSTIEYPTGHVGLAMATGTHRDVWPEVAEWFLDHSEAAAPAVVISDGVERALGVDVETDVTVGDVDEIDVAVADPEGDIARGVVERDAETVQSFLEDALDVDISVREVPRGIAVDVVTEDGARTTVVETVSEAIREEVAESVGGSDIAASYDLEDLEGVGPAYAGRLREAGVESPSALLAAAVERVAADVGVSEELVRHWRDSARALAGTDDPGGEDR